MAQVDCIIVGGEEYVAESGTVCSFIAAHPVTPLAIAKLFPFEGKFHFRLKVRGDRLGLSDSFVWLDLKAGSSDTIPFITADSRKVEIQALILELPKEAVVDTDYRQYLEECNQELGLNPSERPQRGTIEDGSSKKSLLNKFTKGVQKRTAAAAQSIASVSVPVPVSASVQSVAQGVGSMWNKFVSKASEIVSSSGIGGTDNDSSQLWEDNLADLATDVSTGYNDSSPGHLQLLTALWDAHGFGANFERVSERWKEAGWQKNDPVADLKASGVLAVKAMTYLGKHYSISASSMLQRNKANIKANYPFAVVGINLTLLLADVLRLRDHKYVSNSFNALFRDPNAFYEIFCLLFVHMDATWTKRSAVRTDFGKIIGDSKAVVSQVLLRNPSTVQEFKTIALEEGMLISQV